MLLFKPLGPKCVKKVAVHSLEITVDICSLLLCKLQQMQFKRYINCIVQPRQQLCIQICSCLTDHTYIHSESTHFNPEAYVERLNFWNWCMFVQVCELDIIFNFEKAYFILDEFLMGGEIQDTSKKSVLKAIEQADLLQEVSRPSRRVISGCESQKSKSLLSSPSVFNPTPTY